jgi:hypothetical protein
MGAAEAKEMAEMVKRRFSLWRDVVQAGDFVRGSVTVLRRPCTRAGCRRCREGTRHPATYLSLKEQGRTRLIYLPRGLVTQAKAWVAEWRRLDDLLRQMSKTNAEVLRLLGKRAGRRGRRGA